MWGDDLAELGRWQMRMGHEGGVAGLDVGESWRHPQSVRFG